MVKLCVIDMTTRKNEQMDTALDFFAGVTPIADSEIRDQRCDITDLELASGIPPRVKNE